MNTDATIHEKKNGYLCSICAHIEGANSRTLKVMRLELTIFWSLMQNCNHSAGTTYSNSEPLTVRSNFSMFLKS